MQDYKIDLGVVDTSPRVSSSGGTGGAITFVPASFGIGLGDNSGSSVSSPFWLPRVSMNLVRFEMSGEWSFISTDPLHIELCGNDGVAAEITLTGTDSTYEYWTGSVPVDAGDQIWCYIWGGGAYLGEEYFSAAAFGLCITAWFDGEAGGGLMLYADPGA